MNNANKNSHAALLVSFVVTALLVGAPADAQDKDSEIDEIFSWTTPATPGCAVAVSLHGKLVVNRAYGLADLERDVPISTSTVFDVGSVVKQFVAAAVLLLVEEGRLSLSEDVRESIPELPDPGHEVTVDHLLTHTSGIRDWTGIERLAPGDEDALTMILRQRGLNFAAGEEWSYSNSGYVLLKEIVARKSGMSFAEFTQTRLFEPLGMKATTYRTELREVIKNRALAYDKQGGRWRLAMLLDNERGGGGALFSTAGDLILWNEALANDRLGAFVTEKLYEQATLNNGRVLGYARGMGVSSNRGGTVFWHTGSADGYKSVLSRYPEQGLSIAILCNSGDGTPDRSGIARRIFDLFVPAEVQTAETQAPPAAHDGFDAAGLDLGSRAGLFFSESTGEPLRLVAQRGRLRIANGPALVPMSKDRFRCGRASLGFMSQDEFELHFLSQDEFELKSMEGKATGYLRAQPYAPTSEDLQTLAGRYESDEIGTIMQIESRGDGLVMRLEHAPETTLELEAVAHDTFQWRLVAARFHRDEAGKGVAFEYSNPVLRNIRFTRLSDRQ